MFADKEGTRKKFAQLEKAVSLQFYQIYFVVKITQRVTQKSLRNVKLSN